MIGHAPSLSPRLSWRDAALCAAVGLAFCALAIASIAFTRDIGRIAAVWPANAVLLAVALRSQRRLWPALLVSSLIGNIAANALMGDPLPTSAVLSVANTVEIWLSVVLLRRALGEDIDLSRQRHLLVFLAVAGVLAPLASAIGSRPFLEPSHSSLLIDIFRWYAPDALGLVIVTPALLVLTPSSIEELLRRIRAGRGLISALALALSLTIVFGQERYPTLFLIPPALILVAFELDQAGAAVALLVTAAVAVIMTLTGHGPASLILGPLSERLDILQLFLATMSIAVLPVAAALTRRQRLEEELRVSLDKEETAGKALAEAHRITTMAQEIAGVGHWRQDIQTGVRTWSDQMYTMYGTTREALAGRMHQTIGRYHPDDLPLIERFLEEIVANHGTTDMKLRFRRFDDDAERIGHCRGTVELGPDGAVVALIGVMRDITEEETARRQVEQSEMRYRAIADNVTDIISRTSPNGKLVYLSPSVRNVTGYAPEELVGTSLLTRVHPDDISPLLSQYRLIFKGEAEPLPIVYRLRHKDDQRWIWLECNPTPAYDRAGAIVEFIDVTREIGARIAMEAELRATRDAAETATSVKSDFLANMSHEIRTPLTAILGFTNLLTTHEGLDATATTYLSRIAGAGGALLAIVNDVLDFSKLEAGQVEITREAVAVRGLLGDALAMFMPQAQAKGLALSLDVGDDLPPHLMLDADRLRQVLLNLAGNAVKFTKAGSVRLAASYAQERLIIGVEDTGPGLTADQQARLFQRFSQVDASSTRSHGGTGLGLAICKGLVEAMGGEIGLSSEPGQGCRFTVSIPAPVADAPRVAAPQDSRASLDGLRLLVVDDNPVNRELVRAMLAPLGAEVSEAVDGVEAVEIALGAPFDIVLMDIRMPRLDGPSAAARLRAEPGPNQDVPILGFSADIDPAGSDVVFDFDGLVGKPLDPQQLISAILTAAPWLSTSPDPEATPRAA